MSQVFGINCISKKKIIKIKPVKIYRSPSRKKLSINIPSLNINKTQKHSLYDRFIPYGISPNLNCYPPSYSQISSHEKFPENKFIAKTLKKNNYEKCLLADLIGKTSPTQIITNDPRQNIGYIAMMNSKRKVSYSKEKSVKNRSSLLSEIKTYGRR